MLNKYYVGADHIGQAVGSGDNASNTFATLDAAIEEGRRYIRRGARDTVVIVEIVRVLRKEVPITIETV